MNNEMNIIKTRMNKRRVYEHESVHSQLCRVHWGTDEHSYTSETPQFVFGVKLFWADTNTIPSLKVFAKK